MPKKKVVLTFPKNLVRQPIIYHLVKDYNLIINILRAQIMPDEEGKMVIEIEGSKADIDRGLRFLKRQSLHMELLGKDIKLDEQKCIDCGACTAVCATKALSIDKNTKELVFDRTKCVLCGLCAPACPIRVINVVF